MITGRLDYNWGWVGLIVGGTYMRKVTVLPNS